MKNKFPLIIAFVALVFILKFMHEEPSPVAKNIAKTVDLRSYYKEKLFKKKAGAAKLDHPEKYGEIQRQLRTPIGSTAPDYQANYLVKEMAKARKNMKPSANRNELDFVSRGPGNVAGRTRALLIDPRDLSQNSWLAGSASGGIWKTSDAGKNWRNVSEDLTSLSTNTLAMSASNPDVIYAGTGEHFVSDTDGNGLWKSEDNGESWVQIATPEQYAGFRNISRIAVDPDDSDVVILATSNGSWVEIPDNAIWKSSDGGESFTRVYTSELGRIDDIDANPANFSTMYAAIEGYGVIKSTDMGETWFEPSVGLTSVGRVEIAVSEVDTALVWASADGGSSDAGSTIYVSKNAGMTWGALRGVGNDINYLGGQGFYDNIITPHPYDSEVAYVGGVNLFKVSLTGESEDFVSYTLDEVGTEAFIDFINPDNFLAEALISNNDIKSIEIRFGEGSQKAHRFTAGGQGAGVAFGDYQYEDYVDVPFTVWDIENDHQLMASFRDQRDDGAWELSTRNTNGSASTHSREYIFVHNIKYVDEASSDIARTGGNEDSLMYFIWPHLSANSTLEGKELPVSRLVITADRDGSILEVATDVVSDAYQQFSGVNSFSNDNFIKQEGVHPDQHNIVIIKEDDSEKTFRFIVTNDGGVYLSRTSVNPGTQEGDFSYTGFGYNTSQFYGADKAPGERRYIGGMQDNSTFFTPADEEADSSTRYDFAIGGDGFEAIWNNSNPNQLIGASQFNNFARSLDGGDTWISARDGYGDFGPFISRIANSKRFPNRLFTVGSQGVWRSHDFGGFWQLTAIPELWSFNNSADVEVSHADSSVIWAGGALADSSRIFVSRDNGDSFKPVSNYVGEELGFVSGIGTHSVNPSTAYLLFSFAGLPKVIKTTDFGENWEDISGFQGNGGVSDRGFPDVAIQSLLVFPNDTNRIWVGSEIGIVESLDGGESWSLLDCNMPPVFAHEFKIQDDQVVIATYGRGIWSVDVPGIRQDFILPPAVLSARQLFVGDLEMEYYLPSEYDSSHLLVNNIVFEVVKDNVRGDYSSVFDETGLEGDVVIQVESFRNGISYLSPPLNISLFIPLPIITQYTNDFANSERDGEFAGFGFRVGLEEGFEDEAIHSDHPHINQVEYTYLLKSPYHITEDTENLLQFREVAIIEPGEDGSVFGESDFWDFVIVEGSVDALNWEPFVDGYDARAYPDWLSTFNDTLTGTADLYKLRTIDMSETFAIGDTILIRFRLTADARVTAWGWAIDDLEIGYVTSSVQDITNSSRFKIYPNPASNFILVDGDLDISDSAIRIFDMQGSMLVSARNQKRINISDLSTGTYFISISVNGVVDTRKFVKL